MNLSVDVRRMVLYLAVLQLLVLVSCRGPGEQSNIVLPTVTARAAPAASPTSTDPVPTDMPSPTPLPPTSMPSPTPPPPTSIPSPTTLPPTVASTESKDDAVTATLTDTPVPIPSPTATALPATSVPPPPSPPPALTYNTAFILDASGSMWADLGGQARLIVAQDAVGNLSAAMPSSVLASLWVYGHRVEDTDKVASCKDIEQVIPLGPVDAKVFDATAHSFTAKGYTPITGALTQAAASLPVGPTERNSIILVSDGEETCGGDPCALAAQLAASDARVTIHAIGLAVDEITRGQLQCIAEAGGGTYIDAQTADDLSAALEQVSEAASEDTFTIVEGLGRPSVVVVSADGQNVYAAGAESESVVVFGREPDGGRLAFLETHVNGVDGVSGIETPLGLAVSPDGQHVYATGGEDLAMAVFSRSPKTGALSFVEALDVFSSLPNVDRAQAVAVSPDGLSVYVAGADGARADDAIAVYRRDPPTGQLDLVQMIQEGVAGVEGLNDLTGLAVSPDGASVCAVSVWHTMAVFSREPDRGTLTFVQMLEDGVDVVNNGLLGAHALTFSPDSQHVYVTSRRGDAITILGRDMATGALTFIDQLRGKVGATTANLDGAHGLAISPNGEHVYVSSDNADMLLVLKRDAPAGTLAFVEEFVDNTAGIDGLENGRSVAASPDGQNVYVAGFDDDSLAVFARDMQVGALTFVQVIRNRQRP